MERSIGRAIQEARLKRAMTQRVLAETANVSVRWLSKVENGQVQAPRIDYLERVADALGMEMTELVAGRLDGMRARTPDARMRSATLRREAAARAQIEEQSTRWGSVIGRQSIPWVAVSYGPYMAEQIEAHYSADEPAYPPEIEAQLRTIHEDIGRRTEAGEEVPYGSDNFKLMGFEALRGGGLELPRLVLRFGPTTYFRMLTTNQRLDVPMAADGGTFTLRERYAAAVDLRRAPVLEFATYWGVGLSVVTADGLLLVTERGNTAVAPNAYSPSVAEIALRSADSTADGAPDHARTARRGLREELGIELGPDEITWLSLGANSYTCGYALIGRVNTRHMLSEIESRHSVGAAKDSWETRRIHAVEFNPVAVARFCSQARHRFAPITVAAIMHALYHEYGVTRTRAAFADVSMALTVELPSWVERTSAD